MYNFVTIGYDCSPASALRVLNLREYALPFDWIVTNINSLEKCFADNFNNFHCNLRFNDDKTRFIDYYGFEFPHDYPFSNQENSDKKLDENTFNNIGEGVFGEVNGKIIIDNWQEYYNIVKEKYKRRIERFMAIMNDSKPIIILSRHRIEDIIKIKSLLSRYYSKNNIFIINSSSQIFERYDIFNINTEKNGIWNESDIWKNKIDEIIKNNLI